ncbi:hypothetical protein ACLE20_06860 [Rhizobium sp. YIM 134829]|uniref:hypothetical protein n=1 Tax=Rhizobium sp. YIM 134829 TaxID=3390453 RepID=UPI00397BFDC6
MKLVFIYGPVASGKLTIAKIVAEKSGFALFHNHLIVDAVLAVLPFGSPEFVGLREQFWIDTIAAAARTGRSLIFTFAPEPTVSANFAEHVASIVEVLGGETVFVALDLDKQEQERRLVEPERAAFGKLRSVELLRSLSTSMDEAMDAMPKPAVRIDTTSTSARQAADLILQSL